MQDIPKGNIKALCSFCRQAFPETPSREDLQTPGLAVAVDAVKAGEGSFVLLSYGSSARMTEVTKKAPIDAVVMAIVDDLQITEKV